MPAAKTNAQIMKKTSQPLFYLNNLAKIRHSGSMEFRLRVPELRIQRGDKVIISGNSGCGKSTLLDILALALQPTSGTLKLMPAMPKIEDIMQHWQKRHMNYLTQLRSRHIGYVLQTGGLLPFLTVRNNIALPCRLHSIAYENSVATLAQALDISQHLDKLPSKLSVGERQRVAIARAMVHQPSIIIADEPTASLDPVSASRVMNAFMALVQEHGTTVIIASHEQNYIDQFGLRCIRATVSGSTNRITESIFTD